MPDESVLPPEEKQYPVHDIDEGRWFAHKPDCSGFTRAVAADAGVGLMGNANQQIDHMQKGGGWIALSHDTARASRMSGQGYLVIGGVVPGTDHGRVKGYGGRWGDVIKCVTRTLVDLFSP